MTREEALHVLGLPADASQADVTAAYRELAQMLHPDKYGDNKRLRARAERQMATINEARAILVRPPQSGSSSSSRSARTASGASASSASSRGDAAARTARIRAAAAARAQAAETARCTVVAHIRALKETRHRAVMLAVVGLVGMLIASRMRGTLRTLGFPLLSTLAIWGIVDLVSIHGQLAVLRRRARELRDDRDAARAVAAGEV